MKSREPLDGFAQNSHGRRVWSVARTSLKVKVNGQRSRSQGQKRHLLAFSVACVQFMFGKTYLASSVLVSVCCWFVCRQDHSESYGGFPSKLQTRSKKVLDFGLIWKGQCLRKTHFVYLKIYLFVLVMSVLIQCGVCIVTERPLWVIGKSQRDTSPTVIARKSYLFMVWSYLAEVCASL